VGLRGYGEAPESKGGAKDSDGDPEQDEKANADPGSGGGEFDKLIRFFAGDGGPGQDFFVFFGDFCGGFRCARFGFGFAHGMSYSLNGVVLRLFGGFILAVLWEQEWDELEAGWTAVLGGAIVAIVVVQLFQVDHPVWVEVVNPIVGAEGGEDLFSVGAVQDSAIEEGDESA
jgi:hypothetical protein